MSALVLVLVLVVVHRVSVHCGRIRRLRVLDSGWEWRSACAGDPAPRQPARTRMQKRSKRTLRKSSYVSDSIYQANPSSSSHAENNRPGEVSPIPMHTKRSSDPERDGSVNRAFHTDKRAMLGQPASQLICGPLDAQVNRCRGANSALPRTLWRRLNGLPKWRNILLSNEQTVSANRAAP